ncbi:Rap1a/Tai family immunity protein [Parvibaculum sp.]|uniref:Rap1a/Tai family immunity protein n=1 Tax=Parvibaculum sp. TaxID=2024848 RepID=UPI002C813EEF|nr:Rap1a/Tai family immunity protein [Parvibaculum sp.]HUD52120.1 Rap1a/Tai family immunity protein [Parvibaculum sp.]
MSRIIRFAAPMLLAVIASSGALASADIKTGADLVASCKASLEGDRSPQGEISATACNQFLSGMVVAVYNSTEAGMPTALHRLGPKQDETVCFRLPELLKYQDFAALVVAYDKAHPGLAERPAAELAGHSLADKYPCKD